MPITQHQMRQVIDAGREFQHSRDLLLQWLERELNDLFTGRSQRSAHEALSMLRSFAIETQPAALHIQTLAVANDRFSAAAMRRNEVDAARQRFHRYNRAQLHADVDALLAKQQIEDAQAVRTATRAAVAAQASNELGVSEPPSSASSTLPIEIPITAAERESLAAGAAYARANTKPFTPPPASALFGGDVDE